VQPEYRPCWQGSRLAASNLRQGRVDATRAQSCLAPEEAIRPFRLHTHDGPRRNWDAITGRFVPVVDARLQAHPPFFECE